MPLTGYNNMYIGYSNTNNGYFDGRIDDVRVYDRPLTATEVDGEYENGIEIAHWKLDETVAGPVVDTHGVNSGANQGALIGQPGMVGTAYDFNGTSNYVARPVHESTGVDPLGVVLLGRHDTATTPTPFGAVGFGIPTCSFSRDTTCGSPPAATAIEFDLVTQNSNGVKN